jgi:hypothetical protein
MEVPLLRSALGPHLVGPNMRSLLKCLLLGPRHMTRM